MKRKGGFSNNLDKDKPSLEEYKISPEARIHTLEKLTEGLQRSIYELEQELFPEGFWYNREDSIWYKIIKIIKFDKDYLEIKCDLGSKIVKQEDCIVYKHPYHTMRLIEKGGINENER